MITYRCSFADLRYNVSAEDGFLPPRNNPFIIEDKANTNPINSTNIDVICKSEPIEKLELFSQYNPYNIDYKLVDDLLSVYFYGNQKLVHVIQSKKQFEHFTVLSSSRSFIPFEHCAGEVIFRLTVLNHGGIVIHAAGISCNGAGIIFSAPSGTGKSTQAHLWRKHKGAVVLNGDRAALRFSDGVPYLYGSKWSGSSNDFKNDKAPLKAIIMLEQAGENSIRRLTKKEAVMKLMPRCYLPTGVGELVGLAITNLESFINAVPVYLLKCLPNLEAVELTEKAMEVSKRDTND